MCAGLLRFLPVVEGMLGGCEGIWCNPRALTRRSQPDTGRCCRNASRAIAAGPIPSSTKQIPVPAGDAAGHVRSRDCAKLTGILRCVGCRRVTTHRSARRAGNGRHLGPLCPDPAVHLTAARATQISRPLPEGAAGGPRRSSRPSGVWDVVGPGTSRQGPQRASRVNSKQPQPDTYARATPGNEGDWPPAAGGNCTPCCCSTPTASATGQSGLEDGPNTGAESERAPWTQRSVMQPAADPIALSSAPPIRSSCVGLRLRKLPHRGARQAAARVVPARVSPPGKSSMFTPHRARQQRFRRTNRALAVEFRPSIDAVGSRVVLASRVVNTAPAKWQPPPAPGRGRWETHASHAARRCPPQTGAFEPNAGPCSKVRA